MVRILLAILLAGCAATDPPLAIDRVVPDEGLTDVAVDIRIEGVFARPIRSSVDDGTTRITDVSLALDETPIAQMTWRNEGLLEATVPAGLTPGSYDVVVGIGDRSVVIPDGYTVRALETKTWIVIETIVVDTANPIPMTSQQVLENLVEYRFRVSGVITNVIDNFEGDADYYDFSAPKDDGCCEDIGLGIDDLVVDDHDTKPDWGPYRADHMYEASWVGEGRVITALFQDTFYGNNIGNLTLQILAFQ